MDICLILLYMHVLACFCLHVKCICRILHVKILLDVPAGIALMDCSLAVGQAVSHSRVKPATRMKGAVVIFLDRIEKVNASR